VQDHPSPHERADSSALAALHPTATTPPRPLVRVSDLRFLLARNPAQREPGTVDISGTRAQTQLTGLPFHRWLLPDGSDWTLFYRLGQGYLLRFPGLADFELDPSGSIIGCWCAPGTEESTVHHLYLNQVLPLALSRQGRLVVHASAVEIREELAIAFVGMSGSGKSTLAGAFAQLAKPVVCDDGLVIEASGDLVQVLPGDPSIRLWADSLAELIGPLAKQGIQVQYTSKHRLLEDPSIPFCRHPASLTRMYFLGADRSGSIRMSTIPPPEALVEIVKHSFLLDIQDHEELASHFRLASRLVREVGCFRLDYPRRFELLPEVCAAVLKHCED